MAHRVDLHALARAEGVDLDGALTGLRALYAEVDARNARNTASLDLPCKSGCSSCCEESVLLTRLEFFGIWDHVQTHLDDATRADIVERGLALYAAHADAIRALERARDLTRVLRGVRFRCPLLDAAGRCQAYDMREVLGRLFGASFNDEGGIYGCHLVGAHLADKLVTLSSARTMGSLVHGLPMTGRQNVMPFYIHALYARA